MALSTCRFCGKHSSDGDGMVKYGVRHYAHYACYLEAGKKLTDLHDWQIVDFPARLIKQHDLWAIADAAYARLGKHIVCRANDIAQR